MCREYDCSRSGDEWDEETLVDTEAVVAIDCEGCGADLGIYEEFVARFAEFARRGFNPLDSSGA